MTRKMKKSKDMRPTKKSLHSHHGEKEPEERETYFVNGLAKGLRLIQAMGESEVMMTLSDVAQAANLTRASARRLLLTLEDLGFVGRRDERHFFLTPRLLSLGYSYLSSLPLWTFAEPVLEELVEKVSETCSIAVLDDTELVFVLRIPVHRILNRRVTIGSRLPLYCHSAGRILLSSMSPTQLDGYFSRVTLRSLTPSTVTDENQIRKHITNTFKRGYSCVSGEMEDNISGISVPIRSNDGKIIAAINASVNRSNVKQATMIEKLLPPLRAAAEKINASLAASNARKVRS